MNEISQVDDSPSAKYSLTDVADWFKFIFDSVSNGIFIVDPATGRFIDANQPGLRMFGYEKYELMDCDIGTLSSGVPPYTLEDAIEIHRSLCIGDCKIFEWQCKTKEGKLLWGEVSLNYTAINQIPTIVAIVRNISERRRIEQMKSDFVSTVSHELRTPLTSIVASLALLGEGVAGQLPDRATRLIAIARQNSQRLVRLVNDILDMESIESGGIVFDMRPVELRPLVADVIEANQLQADASRIAVQMNAPDGSPIVLGDRDRLTQAVTNLLSNAVKVSPLGSTVTVTVAQKDNSAKICIRDHGPGIPEAFRPRLFQRFTQVDSALARQKGGTGLGLAIVKEIVERHDGCITFECPQQGGTIFQVALPLAEGPARSSAAP